MGINLNSSGGLTVAQTEQAEAMGISKEEMKQFVIDRLIELRGGKTPDTKRTEEMKRDVVTAKNPVLVVAAGPSYMRNYDGIRNFKGIVVMVDFVFNPLVKKGIIPDYALTLESAGNNVNEKMFLNENIKLCRGKTTIIGSSITRNKVVQHFNKKIPFRRFLLKEEPRCSNVGLLAINFAWIELKADKIFLIGFEHNGHKYPPHTYQTWQTDFWYFIRKWPKETIVNCSDGGALYYDDYVIDARLDEVKIV